MKHLKTLTALLASASLVGMVDAAPIAVTGYNTDIIAEGSAAIGTATSGGVIAGQEWTLAATGYTGAGTLSGTPLPVVADTVTTDSGTVYAVDPDANNALVNDGTLTLVTPGQYEELQFLLFMVSNDFTATVNFSDASTTELSETGIGDWQGPNSLNAFAASSNAEEISAVRRSNGQLITLNPRELIFSLSPADQAKTITSIDIDFSSNSRGSIFGISGTVVPEPSSLALLSLGGLMIARRRRG
ncbi:MAG: PEP-CTERM sorting domain-containing protein [Pseudomonadota bacterium]